MLARRLKAQTEESLSTVVASSCQGLTAMKGSGSGLTNPGLWRWVQWGSGPGSFERSRHPGFHGLKAVPSGLRTFGQPLHMMADSSEVPYYRMPLLSTALQWRYIWKAIRPKASMRPFLGSGVLTTPLVAPSHTSRPSTNATCKSHQGMSAARDAIAPLVVRLLEAVTCMRSIA